MSINGNPIEVVSRLTELSAHVIRIWEERYQAVVPKRTAANRRLYSKHQIERLKLLRDLTRAGHSIGLIAGLPTPELRKRSEESSGIKDRKFARIEPPQSAAVSVPLMEECLAAIKALDQAALENALQKGSFALGAWEMILHVIAPLSQRLGELWFAKTITPAHEHFAASVIRGFLWSTLKQSGEKKYAPVLVIATPSGQVHELGALLVAAVAASMGWHVVYLGVNLPAEEIAGAARLTRARAVALSLVYPEDDPSVGTELKLLRKLLRKETTLIFGGRAAPAYQDVIQSIGGLQVTGLTELMPVLEDLRKPAKE